MIKEIKNTINHLNKNFRLNYINNLEFDNESLIELENLMKLYLEQSKLEDIDFQLLFNFILLEIFPNIEDFESALYYIKIVLKKIDFSIKIIDKEVWILFFLNIYTEHWIGISKQTKNIFGHFLNYYESIDQEVSSMIFFEMALGLDDVKQQELFYKKSILLNPDFFNSYINLSCLYRNRGMLKIANNLVLKALSKITKVDDNPSFDELTNIGMFLKHNIIGKYHTNSSYKDVFNDYFSEEINYINNEIKLD